MAESEVKRRSNRRQLLLIAVIAGISVTGSYLLYFNVVGSGVWGTTNQGEFVQPPILAADLDLRDSSGAAAVVGETWWVWFVDDQNCAEPCLAALDKMRAMHVLLHKDANRLRRAWVRSAGTPDSAEVGSTFPKLERWELAGSAQSVLVPGLYIVDPLGNLVFHYQFEQMGKPLLKDLKRLLKVSQIG